MASEIDSLGLESGTVVVVAYDPRWLAEFAAASRELREALGSSIIDVHHVGSTAVPGLCAKPILDLLVSVPDLDQSLKLVPKLKEIGYEFRPDEEIPDRHYFRRARKFPRDREKYIEGKSDFVAEILTDAGFRPARPS